jgi:hypothetical protein
MKTRLARLALAIGVAAGAAAAAEVSEPGPRHPVITSSRMRFQVTGLPLAEAAELAAWAEEVVDRLERRFDRSIWFGRNQPVTFVGRDGPDTGRGQVIKSQGWVEQRLVQRLILVNRDRTDPEDVLEGLCWLLVNRWALLRQPRETRAERAVGVPDWLSVGAAQCLFPRLRARNAARILEQWEQNEVPPVKTILEWVYLADGRWPEKHVAGVFVDWLLNPAGPADRLDRLLEPVIGGRRIDEAVVRPLLVGTADERAMEIEWLLWVAHQGNIRRELGGGDGGAWARLNEWLAIDPAAWGVGGAPPRDEPLRLADLVVHYREDWVRPLAVRLRSRLQALAVGQGSDLQVVIKGYLEFLTALADASASAKGAKPMADIPVRKRLNAQLRLADAARVRFERTLLERRQYLDEVLEQRAPEPAVTEWQRLLDELLPAGSVDREVDRYLEEIERKWSGEGIE